MCVCVCVCVCVCELLDTFLSDGIGYKGVLDMCQRFQLHLGESAKIVSSEQVSEYVSRLV